MTNPKQPLYLLRILHHNEQECRCLKGKKHGDNKWVVNECEDVKLQQQPELEVPCHLLPLSDFHGKALTSLPVVPQLYSPGQEDKGNVSNLCD